MVKSVDFAVRGVAGGVSRGMVAGDGASDFIQVGNGDDISLNLRKSSILKYVREGSDLEVVLVDGRTITLSGFYDAHAHLYISADGELTHVTLTDGGDGVIYADYSATEVIGKWSPNDQLAFLNGEEILAPAGADDTSTMAAFAPALLGGAGSAGLAGAGLVGLGALGGGNGGTDPTPGDGGTDTTPGDGATDTTPGDGGTDPTPGDGGTDTTPGDGGTDTIVPTVDNPDAESTLTTNTTDPNATVSGTGEAGSTVVVTLGDQTIETTVGDDGTWGVTFEDTTLPGDGDYTSTVFVTAPDGTLYELDGPDFLIDMTPPPVEVTAGAVSTGDVENLAEYQDGISVSGTGEAGASIVVEVAGETQTTTVNADGSWSVTFTTGQLPEGEYQEAMTITATDALGNVTTITDTLAVDTVPNQITFNSVTSDNVINAVEIAGNVVVSGSATAGAVLDITVEGVTHQVTAAGDGSWQVSYAPGELPAGTYETTITATSVDAAGNASSASWAVQVDTQASVAFLTGHVTADNVVNAAEDQAGFTLNGVAEPGSTVVVTLGGVTETATVAADGSWSADFSDTGLSTGTHIASVIATDVYGNTASDTMPVVFDTSTTVAFDAAQVGGDDLINGIERSAGIVLTGTAEAGATVAVTFEGVTRTVMAGGDGSWQASFGAGEISSGSYVTTATVTATDAAGNVATASHVINVDTDVHNLTHTTPTPNAIFADDIVNAQEGAGGLVVTGTTEVGSSVTVQLASGATVAATVLADGTWGATIPAGQLPVTETNDVVLTVRATDSHGNTAVQTSTVDFDPLVSNFSLTGPVTSDNVVNAQEAAEGFAITGTVEAGSHVAVMLANGAVQTVTAGADGQWSVTFSDADLSSGTGAMTYHVVATDPVGNVASTDGSFAFDLVAPDSPDIIAFTRDAGSLLGIRTDVGENTYDLAAVDGAGHVNSIDNIPAVHETAGYSSYDFYETVPNGSYLVVSDHDTAGNETSTLLVVDNTSAVTVDLTRTGLTEFDFGTIDLTFAPEANLTITEAQLNALTGPDHTLVIQGDAADHVTALGAQDTGADTLISGHSYSVYTLGDDGAHLVIDDNITNLTI